MTTRGPDYYICDHNVIVGYSRGKWGFLCVLCGRGKLYGKNEQSRIVADEAGTQHYEEKHGDRLSPT